MLDHHSFSNTAWKRQRRRCWLAFIGASVALRADRLEDHAAYIDGWLKVLADNPPAFLTAASKAQAAADWILREMGAG